MIAVEYASVLSKLSLGVTVIANTYLPGIDVSLRDTLLNHMKKNVLFISDEITELENKEKKVLIRFKNGRVLQVDMVLFCGGRVANTDSLDLHLCKKTVEIGRN